MEIEGRREIVEDMLKRLKAQATRIFKYSCKACSLLLALTVAAFSVLTGCGADKLPNDQLSDKDIAEERPSFEITDEDVRVSFAEEVVKVDLNEIEKDLKKQNIEEYEILDGGDYLLSGDSDIRIVVNSKEEPVHLFLDGVTLTRSEGNAILVKSASKVVITCLDGTENVISDSGYYELYKDNDSCIYSFSDLTINGRGSLRVTGLYEDAIHSKDVIKIIDTGLEVRAKGDGIRGNDGVCILNSKVVSEAEKNGIRTSKNGHDVKGCVEIKNSEASVIAGEYAIEAYDMLMVSGSSLYLNGVLGKWQVAGDVFVEEGDVNGN